MLLVPTYLAASKIAGIGVFAGRSITKGAAVWRFVAGFDVLLPHTFVHAGDPSWVDRYTQQCRVTGLLLLCPDDARHINHSDDPNVDSSYPLFHAANVDCALRDIAEGEELTTDYRLAEAEPFKGFPGYRVPRL